MKHKTLVQLIVISIIFYSCMGKRITSFLVDCNSNKEPDGYCLTTVREIKENLSQTRPLFYLGSDSIHHFFIYAYDKTVKISARMKIDKSPVPLPYNVFEKKDDSLFYDFPVYLADLIEE